MGTLSKSYLVECKESNFVNNICEGLLKLSESVAEKTNLWHKALNRRWHNINSCY
jgi:hypothetical protein